ncbi:hypothetical protein CJ672_06470 [Arcobacter cryaerophilus gv. occultus]|uniref:6-hydroxymethylpterin diphosphokinase MptE-like protein n=1 Tax=Aliarcobacter cryaerophilus TaxID=28198 RepID=UPI000D01D956|nr:6-hydroxymethylpterin diphosphokinase MptE-like protein [Aliarcobacter cryaerophilus]PRM92025.1 hypothetical protein CJ672_06470 [Arcobacter cryaerophilus gv. occultus]
MTEAQIQLQNALTTTFLANLAFLSEYDNELYHRIDELSRMIEQGTYKEKYALEFNMQDGDFDIYDIINDKYLYNKKPKKFNSDLVRKVEFDNKFSILNLPTYFIFKQKIEGVYEEDKFNLSTRLELANLTLKDTLEYSNYLKAYQEKKNKKIKKIDKFIFLGTLLGRHIPKIAEKLDAQMYLVVERNLEIFRLSLFTIDYTILAKKGVVFSIMDSNLDEVKKIDKFFSTLIFDNYLIKFSTTSINIDSYIDTILTSISSLNPETYDYNRQLYIHINRATKYIKNYNFPMFPKIKKECNILKDTPVLYLAPGPSLEENIEWIKLNQNKFYIVTVGAALKKLLDNNIRIDMVISVDESDIIEKIQFNDEILSKLHSDTITLMSNLTYENILKKLKKENLFLYEIFIPFYSENSAFNGFSVGEIGLNIITKLNPKAIYLLGLDLALNQKTGASHSEGSNSKVLKINLEDEQIRDTFSDQISLIKIKGNVKKEVVTNTIFYSSVKYINSILENKPKKLKIYNLSSHGAYFINSIAKKAYDTKLEDIEALNIIKNNLYIYLKDSSKSSLDKNSIKFLKKEYIFVEKEIKQFLENFKTTDFNSFDQLQEKIYEVLRKILENNHILLYKLFIEYCSMIFPYLLYYFNDSKIKDEDKKIKKVRDIFIIQLERICDDFKICLERVII